ncbi:Protein of unknown function, partial [Gryllus bimaculatus]
WFVP